MADTYKVVKGDTLSELAVKFNTTVAKLVSLNNIKDPDLIIIGQVLRLNDNAPTTSTRSSSNRCTIDLFGIQSNTERTMYATWNWSKSHTKNYETMWYYATGDGVWFVGSDSTTEYKQSVYTPPSNATKVKFKVRAISDKYTDSKTKKEVNHWQCEWSTEKEYTLPVVLKVPPTPDVKIEKYKLTATLDNLDVDGNQIEFYVCKDNTTKFASAKVTISNDNYVAYSCNVTAGSVYKVRARTVKGDIYSEWSDYSANVETAPRAPEEIHYVKANSATEVVISWEKVPNAKTYEIEYSTLKRYFDSSDETTTKTVDATVGNHAEITGLETGHLYHFRVRACNDGGKSGWTAIKSIVIGKKPTAPTTWSSSTTGIVGESINLYWVHNAEDGSSQTYATLELNINGSITSKEIKNTTDEEEKDKTSVYTLNTSSYTDGTVVKWRVKTKGILDEYSDWSTQRTIEVYAPAILELEVNDVDGNPIEILDSFPLYVHGVASPNTQKPVGYHVAVVANESYETVDQTGNSQIITEGDEVYSKYFDTDEELILELSAGNISLSNNIPYTVYCTVSMNTGLTADASYNFKVGWSDTMYEPNAAMSYDPDTYTMVINPYCDASGESEALAEGVLLSVYRLEYDGSLTEIATDIENSHSQFITDPHPSLHYARYRIVAKSKATGKVGFFDTPGHYVGEKAIIIQWDEEWKDLIHEGDDPLVERAWTGSLLRLLYNVDFTDSNEPDVEYVNYIGRENPVSYHGTQMGITSTLNTDIDKYDDKTVYALRRLARWMGKVYVRIPSGIGYWAVVKVSFNTKHKDVIIPVTLNITKVEGGM